MDYRKLGVLSVKKSFHPSLMALKDDWDDDPTVYIEVQALLREKNGSTWHCGNLDDDEYPGCLYMWLWF